MNYELLQRIAALICLLYFKMYKILKIAFNIQTAAVLTKKNLT